MFVEKPKTKLEELFNAFRHRIQEVARAKISPNTNGKNKVFHKIEITFLQTYMLCFEYASPFGIQVKNVTDFVIIYFLGC